MAAQVPPSGAGTGVTASEFPESQSARTGDPAGEAAQATKGTMSTILSRTKNLETPSLAGISSIVKLVLGIVNCIFFGVGVIIAGVLEKDVSDIIIGVLQIIIPFVGWIWAIFWGVKMVIESCQHKDASIPI